MNPLLAALKIALANTFVFYFRAHSYHWNVEGSNFPQYHEFFGNLYEELHEAVDPIAEHIRAVNGYAPISLHDLLTSATITEDITKPVSIQNMLMNLENDNKETIASLNKAFDLAAGDNGLQNFLADRLDVHAKHGWMLKSSQNNVY